MKLRLLEDREAMLEQSDAPYGPRHAMFIMLVLHGTLGSQGFPVHCGMGQTRMSIVWTPCMAQHGDMLTIVQAHRLLCLPERCDSTIV